MGFKNSSGYQKAVIEHRLKIRRSMLLLYQNKISAQSMMLFPRNASCSVIFWVRLCVSTFFQTLTHLSSGCIANIDSFVNKTPAQSDTLQLIYYRHFINRVFLDWKDRGTQSWDTWANSSFMRLCTVMADIILPMDGATINVTCVEIALRFCLATTAMYWSFTAVVTRHNLPFIIWKT